MAWRNVTYDRGDKHGRRRRREGEDVCKQGVANEESYGGERQKAKPAEEGGKQPAASEYRGRHSSMKNTMAILMA